MKRLLLFIAIPFFCAAQVPEYYSDIDLTLTGDALKSELAALITETHTYELIYTPDVWNALKQSDLDPENTNNVLLIYGYDDTDSAINNDRTRDKNLSCHTSGCAGKWVREHVYARSIGVPNLEFDGPGSDAHHLRSIDNSMNGSRSNRLFTAGNGNATILPNDTFYPGDEWRGDVARMMMYMYVRYGNRCKAINIGTGDALYSTGNDMPDIFLQWNDEDPVSQYEINRNDVLQGLQGNRNPFIDNPYLATRIWNGPQADDNWELLATDKNALTNIFAYPTLTTGVLYIQNPENRDVTYKVHNALGQEIIFRGGSTVLDITGNAPGVYFLTIFDGAAFKTSGIILK